MVQSGLGAASRTANAVSVTNERRPIPMPRLVAGILLHFCVPAYLVASLLACLLVAPRVTAAADIPSRMLWTGAWFVPAFLLLTALAAGIAALVEPRLRTPATDPAIISHRQLGEAGRMLAGLHHRPIDAALARVDAVRWDHGDPRDQRLAADLATSARTLAAAVASATPVRRPEVLALAADIVERLAGAAEALANERGKLDEGDARTVAGYLQARYGD